MGDRTFLCDFIDICRFGYNVSHRNRSVFYNMHCITLALLLLLEHHIKFGHHIKFECIVLLCSQAGNLNRMTYACKGHGGSYHSPQHTFIFIMHHCVSTLPTTFLLEHFEPCLSQGQPHAHIRTHKFQCRPSHYYIYCYSEITHSCTASPYLAAWMSGPLAYVSFPQTFAPSHRAQVLI